MNNALVAVSGIISKETAKAVYVAMIWIDGGGGDGGCVWIPKSQLHELTRGKPFPNHRADKTTEWRTEFSAQMPEWLARKVMPAKTGPIPMAQRPW